MIKFLRKLDWYFSGKILKKKYIKRRLQFFSMYLDTQTLGISKVLGIKRTREDDMIFLIRKYLKKGSTVVDCGSNIGFYPLLEAHILDGQGEILCIEPDPRNYELLKKNLSLIPSGVKITGYNIAISSQVGSMNLYVGCASNLNKIIHDASKVAKEHVIEVPVKTIDSLADELNIQPDFIRMDIEGHEVDVIKGMRKVIEQAKAGFTLFFELHPDEYSETNSLSEQLFMLREHGFRCEVMVSAGVPIPDIYKSLGYSPDMTIRSDGRTRGVYYGVSYDDAIVLATAVPKASRYILLIKG